MTDEARVLVVANETLVGQELVDAVKSRAERGPIRVAVVAPVNEPSAGYVVYEDSRRPPRVEGSSVPSRRCGRRGSLRTGMSSTAIRSRP